MPRTRFRASAIPAVLLFTAACAGGRARPAPAPMLIDAVPSADSTVAASTLSPPPDRVDEGFAIERVPNATVGHELLGSAEYDLPVEANAWVASELNFLVTQRHDVVGRWLERGQRYADFVRQTFASEGIPRDLHHLAMVESGYQPTARSRAGAVGMWQFMAGTGRGMGLRIDEQVDERMDPVRSTRAAARHLRQLWEDFGHDWALAAAAYNAGGGRISRGMQGYGARDFWDLAAHGNLAEETRRYVPRLYAVTIIAKDPARYGYVTSAVRPFEFDSVQVDLATPLPVLAQAGGIPLSALADLNPHLLRGMAPAYYWVWVPKGTGAAVKQAYAASEFHRHGGFAAYTLRRGESAAEVALASAVTVERLRELNPGTDVDALGAGDRVRVYADAARALEARPVHLAARDGDSGGRRSFRRGSDRENPDAADDEGGLVRARYVPQRGSDDGESATARRSSSRADDEDGTIRRSSARSEDEDGPSRRSSGDGRPARRGEEGARLSGSSAIGEFLRHVVGEGETLSSIARAYEVSAARIRAANGLDEGERVHAGQRLRIPRAAAQRSGGIARDGSARLGTVRHVVERGETLYGIARQYDTTVGAIRDANDLGADSVLQPGQMLRIPRHASGGER